MNIRLISIELLFDELLFDELLDELLSELLGELLDELLDLLRFLRGELLLISLSNSCVNLLISFNNVFNLSFLGVLIL